MLTRSMTYHCRRRVLQPSVCGLPETVAAGIAPSNAHGEDSEARVQSASALEVPLCTSQLSVHLPTRLSATDLVLQALVCLRL